MGQRKRQKQTPPTRPRRGRRAEVDTRLALVDGAAILGAPRAPFWLRALLPVLVSVCAFVTFWPALSAGFVNWDDDKTIVDNGFIREFNFSWAFTKSKMGHYHPLTWLSYGVDCAISRARFDGLHAAAKKRYESGLDPRVFHFNNLLLHAGVAVAFYFLARLLLRIALPPPSHKPDVLTPLAAGVAALLFACHPLRVENAVWVTERRDVLSALFLLPCLHCYLRYVLTARWGKARLLWYVASVLLLALSLLSKAWGITLPAVMLLLDVHPLKRIGPAAGWHARRMLIALVEKIPFVALAVYFAVRAKAAQADQLATMKSLAEWGVLDRIMQAFYGLFFYAWKTLVPVGLTPLVQLPPENIRNMLGAKYLVAALVVIAVAVVLIVLRKRWPAGVVMGLIYAGTLSPILGIAQSGPQLVADKYAYIGCLVWPLAGAAGLIWLWRKRPARPWARWAAPGASVMAMVLFVTYAALAWRQSGYWENSHALWARAVAVDPQCVLARSNLGMLERQAGNVDTAIEHYQAAIAVDPNDAILLNNYANALRQDPANNPKAIELLRRAIKLMPKLPDLHYTLANLLIAENEIDEAVTELEKCIRLKKIEPKFHRKLGEIELARRNLDDAEKHYRSALALEENLNPKGRGVINACDRLGWIMIYRRDAAGAARWFNRILTLDPDNRGAKVGLARAQNLGN